jgi:asparagine synthase (glutamine-hydrolysing)
MCGICGVIQIDGARRPVVSPETLDRMTDLMTHRGPDDRGVYLGDGAAIGVRRLSIVDIAGGHQPVTNESGTVWAAQNGELYNHEELRKNLERDGHRFRSTCDTEVLPHLYERDGFDMPKALRGKFAFVAWDVEMRRGIVSRDRLGVKPLYYSRQGDLLIFASELKSLLASGLIPPELDPEAIESYLTLGYFAGPSTPLAHVFKLLPGHSLVIENETLESKSYWRLPFPTQPSPALPDQEYAEGLLEVLDEAVQLRLMSDVPLGAMLSGGLDSSVVVALMARHSTSPVKTFSVAFTEDVEGNELSDARLVASTFGTEHHELELSLRDEPISLEQLVWSLDEPLADLSALGMYALSRLAAEHVTVALSGQGADELLGGYPSHRNAAIADTWERVPRMLRPFGPAAARHAPARYRRAADAVTQSDPVSRFLTQSTKLDPVTRTRLLRGRLASVSGSATSDITRSSLGGHEGTNLAGALYLSQQLGLVDDMLHYFDRVSMANSLEVRVPFLDHHVVEYCSGVPDRLKVRRLEGKHLLRVVARGLIPDRIIEKKKVGFFSHSVNAWFAQQADHAVADYLCTPDPAYAEIIDPQYVEELVRNSRAATTRSTSALLLSILMLEIWLSSFLPAAIRDHSVTESASSPSR